MARIPTLIHGSMGETEEQELDRTDGTVENDNEVTTWVEYRLKGSDEIVHRSVHVRLKTPVTAEPAIGGF
jgi:hypothetical protein